MLFSKARNVRKDEKIFFQFQKNAKKKSFNEFSE